MPAAISEHPPLLVPPRSKKRLTRIAQVTLYVAGALAIMLGIVVWPGNVHAAANTHAFAGWLVIASLWTLAVIGARRGVSHGIVWLSAGWGLATTFGALAEFQMPGNGWVTAFHVVTGIGSLAWGQMLVTRIRHAELGARPLRELVSPDRPIKEAAAQFLANKRIAVTGVSRHPAQHGSNVVYRRLRERGYRVFAVNPNALSVEGDRAYPSVQAIPGGVDAVVIATRADRALETMRQCADLGIKDVWMHRSIGGTSVSEAATVWGRQHGLRVIDGGCPLMFGRVSDPGHTVMRTLLTLTGKVPRRA